MARPKTDTYNQILNVAERLMEERGYCGFSYQDIADELGIRKASVHYHFPGKADLGMAVTDVFARRIAVTLRGADQQGLGGWKKLDAFIKPFADWLESGVSMSMTVSLSSDFESLPEPMQVRAEQFYTVFHDWLTHALEEGRDAGEFSFAGHATTKADVILATLEGAVLIGRVRPNPIDAQNLITDIKLSLKKT